MLIYHLLVMWFTVVFFISGLYINFLQLLVLPLFWINRDLYRFFILKLCYCLFSEITAFAEWWGNMNITVYSTEKDLDMVQKEKSIILINHNSDVDWLAAWILGERIGIVQSSKVLLKDMVKFIPTLGWSWWFAEYAFVKRQWDKDQRSLLKDMTSLREHKHHFSLTLFCEGTRRTDAKLKASQDYALQNNIKPLKHHLLPRTKGFAFVVRELGKTVNVLCDLQLGFSNLGSCNIGTLINRGRIDVHLHMRCLPMSSVPSSSMEDSSAYCRRIYYEKDELSEYFHQHGRFPGQRIHLPRKYWNLLSFICHNVLVGCILLKMFHFCLHSLSAISMIATSILFGISVLAFYKVLIDVTQTHKGSAFGLSSKDRKLN